MLKMGLSRCISTCLILVINIWAINSALFRPVFTGTAMAAPSNIPNIETADPSSAPSVTAGSTPTCYNGDHTGSLGLDPDTFKGFVSAFCKDGMGSTNRIILGSDLDPPVDTNGISVNLIYSENCPQSCTDTYSNMVLACQYDSHTIIGHGDFSQPCGEYAFSIISPPDPDTPNLGIEGKVPLVWGAFGIPTRLE